MSAILLLLAACTGSPSDGPDDTGSSDDTGAETFSAQLRIILPSDTPEGAEVMVDGAAVPSCDFTTHECTFTVSEPATYTVEVECDGLYFVPQVVELTESNNAKDVNVSWNLGGCDDPGWSPGDGYCESWSPGQVSCDFAGSWRGVEDDYRDYEADIEMDYIDSDGNGQYEVVLSGNTPFTTSVNGSGTWFYYGEGTDSGAMVSGEVVDLVEGDFLPTQSCDDLEYIHFYRILGSGSTVDFHIERE